MIKIESGRPKSYEPKLCWKITGVFTTTSPLHIGSGETTTHEMLTNPSTGQPIEVAEVERDHARNPCIPGSAIKGVLRSWAERYYGDRAESIKRIFGEGKVANRVARAGLAEFSPATLISPDEDQISQFKEMLPYWRTEKVTGILSHVCIERHHGTAEKGKVFSEEFVPEGVSFAVEIFAERLTEEDVQLLLAVLQHGPCSSSDPIQFGANGADGWGRVSWTLNGVSQSNSKVAEFDEQTLSFKTTWVPVALTPIGVPASDARFIAMTINLHCLGAFLVNDTSRTNRAKGDTLPHFFPLRRADGGAWLPASSLRGVLRQRAEFVLRSLDPNSDNCSIERLFGMTGCAASVRLQEPTEVQQRRPNGQFCFAEITHQDFVAIDRFTGGAAVSAKFEAKYVDRPVFSTSLHLDTSELTPSDCALLAASLRDLIRGDLVFGFAGSKGYGEFKASLDESSDAWLKSQLPSLPAPQPDTVSLPVSVQEQVATKSIPGKLIYQNTRNGRIRAIVYQNKKGEWTTKAPTQIDFQSLPESLQRSNENEVEIDFEWQSTNKPYRIRERGAIVLTQARHSLTAQDAQGKFAHAYYFLTQEDRKNEWPHDLGDRKPVGHERYHSGFYSGTIRVNLRTETPLLICDDQNKSESVDHLTYDMRVDETSQKPILHASSVRGMLRSAYEAITNSRFGVFLGHEDRLGLRFTTGEGLGLLPCRVEGGKILRLPGASNITPSGPNGPMYAAWLPYYPRPGRPQLNLDGTHDQPMHRQHVCCWIERWERTPWDHREKLFRHNQKFQYWKVLAIAPEGKTLAQPLQTAPKGAVPGENHHTSLGMPLKFIPSGFVCVTGFNFDRKHDERVFFNDGQALPTLDLTDNLTAAWENLIRNYRTNQDLVNERPRPSALTSAFWSRHMEGSGDLHLTDGSLVYSRIDASGKITELYPVMIARKLYPHPPKKLLRESLLPAANQSQLSPADRVFGWVSQDGETSDNPAYRSQLRVGVTTCKTENAVDVFPTPIVLPILGQPKPAQGRFYLGNQQGQKQGNGGSKTERGYTLNNRIRGPKVYPHHCRFALSKIKSLRCVASKQNRTITGCVKKDTHFALNLNLLNVSRTELGALVWLLSLPPDHYLRLGLGKPLGFGSVRLEIDFSASCIADGKDWIDKLREWETRPEKIELSLLKAEYESKMNSVNPLLLQSFLQIAKGFGEVDVKYPPAPNQPGENGQHFKWFMANENRVAGAVSLPDISDADPLLPLIP